METLGYFGVQATLKKKKKRSCVLPFELYAGFSFFLPYWTGVTSSTMSVEGVRVDILVFFMILRGKPSIVTIKYDVRCCFFLGL